MKKFINSPEAAVEEMLQGLVVLHPGSARLQGHKVIVRRDADQAREPQVAVLSGGGSGHEPAHAGYVGAGMLSAAVAGEVFTSPSSDSVLAAIRAVAGAPGALLVVKNYTGDRLNFGLAAEMARSEGIPVDVVLVDDDVALRGTGAATGARGLAGTIFIHKLLGAAAAEGKPLPDLVAEGRAAVESLATMGVSFSAGTSPAVGKPSFVLGEREMELGLGIHGEPGVRRAELQAADELTETLLAEILERGNFGQDRRVAVMVNNLGATTQMELAIVARHAVPFLESKGLVVERIYAGTFLSSLDMAGISISVLGLTDERLRWLDAPTTAPAWPNAARERPGRHDASIVQPGVASRPLRATVAQGAAAAKTRRAIQAACDALIDAAPELTEMDRLTGDGDLGVSLERGATAVQGALDSFPLEDVPATLKAIGEVLGRELGGSSGPLYAVLFLRCASVLERSGAGTPSAWAAALDEACGALAELGGARPGDRTMLDALDPFVKELKRHAAEGTSPGVLLAAAAAAERGAQATASMLPRLGRSSYLGQRVLGHADPGATALAVWLRSVCETLSAE